MAHTRSTPVTERTSGATPATYTRVIASLLEMYGAGAILFLIQKLPVLLMRVENFRPQRKTVAPRSDARNPLYLNYFAAGCAFARELMIDSVSRWNRRNNLLRFVLISVLPQKYNCKSIGQKRGLHLARE